MLTLTQLFERFLERFRGVRGTGDSRTALCPAHDDSNASLSLTRKQDKVLAFCHAGCATEDVLAAVGLETKDLFLDPANPMSTPAGRSEGETFTIPAAPKFEDRKKPSGRTRPVASYVYRDENGRPLYLVERHDPKGFTIRRFEDGKFVPGLGDVRHVPYRLDVVNEAIRLRYPIFVVEGEKDVETLTGLVWEDGTPVVATCNHGGALKWRDVHSEALRGASLVYLIPDNDEVGRRHTDLAAEGLGRVGVPVRFVDLPVGPKQDVTDFFEAGGTPEALFSICRRALEYVPPEEGATGVAGPAGVAGGALVLAGHAEPTTTTRSEDDPLPFRPFPVGALPASIRAFVEGVARSIPCDPSMVALPVLAILASLVGPRYRLVIKRLWTEVAVLWTLVVGEPGTAKSPAFNAAADPLRKIDLELRQASKEAVRDYNRAVKEAKRAGKTTDVDRPAERRLYIGDATAEAALLRVEQTGCNLLLRDELAGWLG